MSDRQSNVALLGTQVGYQNKVFFRTPIAAFFTIFFPLMIFVVFSLVFGNQYIEELGVTTAQYFAPAMAVFAAVSASYTNIATTTAYQRDMGILKRIRGTPLPASVYMGGKIVSAVLIAALSVVIMMGIGILFYGVEVYARTLPAAIVTFLIGVGTFSALGLLVAALVPTGESATAVTNATLLPLAFISGVFLPPSDDAPVWLETVANIFPLKHFVEPFSTAFNPTYTGSGWNWASLTYLLAWGIGATILATRLFKWEPSTGSGSRRRRRRATEPS
ncbi:MAG: ABC transporter permease [Actinomycetia bacterium]|nr:ABC transporter permease [Actinomycetes bacterium]